MVYRASLVATTALLTVLCSPAAMAQAADSGATDLASAGLNQVEAAAQPSASTDIVVTGSRIARRDYSSPTPIVTTDKEAIERSGISNVEEALNILPQFVRSGDATSTGRSANGLAATLDLRGLGANRNLVLLDGRRLPLASAQGVVDVNIIPSALVQNIETITGGASAVYGSDAVSGVVNFLTSKNFEGLQLDAQYGNTFKTDRETTELSFLGGGGFDGDRGHALISLGYTDRQRLRGTSRGFLARTTPSSYIGTGAYVPTPGNLPDQGVLNATFNSYDGMNIDVPRSGGPGIIGFNDDGTLFLQNSARNYLGPTSGDYIIRDGAVRHPFGPTTDITSAQKRRYAFGRFSYELIPNVEGYAQFLYVNSVTDEDDGATLTQYGNLNTIPVTNPFIPDALRPILASRPDPNANFQFNDRYVGVPHKGFHTKSDTYQVIVGLRGDLGIKDWTYDAYYSSDQTNSTVLVRNSVVKEFVQNLYDAPDGGRSICAGGFNPFGDANAHSLSQECIDYITVTLKNTQMISQDILEGSVQGGLFDLPAGEVRFSVTADRRVQQYDYSPDSRGEKVGAIEALSAQVPVSGKLSVNEISGELLIPVLSDVPFAKSLNLGLAYRYSDYNYAGGNSTYKADIDWTVTSGILLRGGYARAVRAPNMAESFYASQSSPAPIGAPPTGGEPCDVRTEAHQQGGAQLRDLCIATGVPEAVADSLIEPTTSAGNAITSGNTNLAPEVADTFTVGIVLRPTFGPEFLQSFSFSADFYDISIDKVISTIDAPQVINSCYNQNGANPDYSPTNVYCLSIHRNSNGILTSVDTPFMNLGGLHVQGIDFTAAFNYPVGPGRLGISANAGYKIKDEVQDFDTSPVVDYVGTDTRYKWRVISNISYSLDRAQAGIRFRYTGPQRDETAVTRPDSPAPGTNAFFAVDLNGSFDLTDQIQLRGGIVNLIQPDAPLPDLLVPQTSESLYDPLGTRFYIAVRARI